MPVNSEGSTVGKKGIESERKRKREGVLQLERDGRDDWEQKKERLRRSKKMGEI